MIPEKATYYTTARALVSCAAFQSGDYVAVKYYCIVDNVRWFLVAKTKQELVQSPQVCFAEHQLADFVL